MLIHNLVFMGTPLFAAASLDALLADGHGVVGVFTGPDKPKGRGHHRLPPPVKEVALSWNIPVFQPLGWRDGQAVRMLRALQPDLVVVVAYGRILPEEALSIPPLGCLNLHASLLPQYRGASPIQSAVCDGAAETGVTTMYMAPCMDTGDIIYAERTPIGEDETAGALADRLMTLGAALLKRTVRDVLAGTAPRIPQDDAQATYTALIRKEDARIDWTRAAAEVARRVRGLHPWPVAFAGPNESPVKIHAASETGRAGQGRPGDLLTLSAAGLDVLCGDGKTILVTRMQAKGSRCMAPLDYFNGHPWLPSFA